jgi:hypothetical protein
MTAPPATTALLEPFTVIEADDEGGDAGTATSTVKVAVPANLVLIPRAWTRTE